METINNPVQDWAKMEGLLPCIVQDANTRQVLMLGYMNEAALVQTLQTGKVTFYSRSRQQLWTKGETSGNFLTLKSMAQDCDGDALLIMADPAGPVCHTGAENCFGTLETFDLKKLETIISQSIESGKETSYTAGLYAKGIRKIAQKVGEEAVETILEAECGEVSDFKNECADLLFHLLLLLRAKQLSLADIEAVLSERHQARKLATVNAAG
jgi:phosphoribosyl-ATP pyrophosphohydrolase/phosphoribosyl-AMP cyclohydrolase